MQKLHSSDGNFPPINPNPKKTPPGANRKTTAPQAGDVDIMSQPRESRDFDGKGTMGVFCCGEKTVAAPVFRAIKTAVFTETNGLQYHLGGGFKHVFLCSPLLGEMIQFDEHIFQMG